ncbi:MAG TPA: hypothetical protein VE398_10885 [Acidobacteriota bacterium]|nr:hypothetical protein [Acidobacteriota bacterium]
MPRVKFPLALGLLAFSLSVFDVPAKEPKLKAEELVAKHLASLGTPEARAAVKNRVVSGSAQMIPRLGGTGQLAGKGNILSEGRKLRFAMGFSALDYPGDQIGFDGERMTVGQIRPGVRSDLSKFIYTYDMFMKEGLLGGVLSTAWPLLDLAARQPKLDYTGLKKIEGKQCHEVKYRAKKGSGDLQVSLDFDAESFRHVRTQYRLVQPPMMVSTPGQSSGQRDTVYTLVEQFDGFKEVDGLMLPHSYKLDLTIEGQDRTIMTEWVVAVTQIAHNQEIDPKYYVVQ